MQIGDRVQTPHGVGVIASIGRGKDAYARFNYGILLDQPVEAALGILTRHAVAIEEDMQPHE